jgi:regulator of protease activity HflC (stomatin/prohibitin superfamily)
MVFLIIGIILTIGLFVGLGFKVNITETTDRYGYTKTNEELYWKLNPKQLLSLLGLLICVFGCFTRIPANSVGIVYSPFGGTQEQTLTEGFKSKNILDKIYKISTETQTMNITNLSTQTQDSQYVISTIDIQYKVDAENAYKVFKQYRTLENMSNKLIIQTTQRALEHVTTTYNVIDILGSKRNEVYEKLEADLTAELANYGVEFVSITINDMDAGEALEKAITDEAVAKKAVETAEQNLLKAEKEAKQKSVQAQAEQDAAKIEAETKLIEAEAEKKANELLNQSLSDDILQKAWIDKWNGQMPTYYAGDGEGSGIMFDASGVTSE